MSELLREPSAMARNRIFATIVISTIAAFLMGMAVWYTYTLSSNQFCINAAGIEKATGENRTQITLECIKLLNEQVHALGNNGYIVLGTLALTIIVLVVIVIARGKVSIDASKEGVSAEIGKE